MGGHTFNGGPEIASERVSGLTPSPRRPEAGTDEDGTHAPVSVRSGADANPPEPEEDDMRVLITVATRLNGETREYQTLHIPAEDLGHVAYVEVGDIRHDVTGAIGGAAASLIESQTVEVEPTHPDEGCAICHRETPTRAVENDAGRITRHCGSDPCAAEAWLR